ncbi:GNAT family N-acetyltransferase [Candidatus Galacturonibacter soehngenii]|uniref:N-acetyltransferase n=1 Tax=Candidatus Galacturonatibacter soehngenii TaxID=2307010 RepID=A0A7V7QN82_9FIRM|nr:GNAT family N-acetyltransferase [Candidatus Galacturonibacter soehngenii]KAB1440426.1 N-acetyltransferase [Candidatus Galacturonibacter soehngenii]MBA4688049.1 N-acetyltransferase [Candidatus Galacturonibacter soehngenii]
MSVHIRVALDSDIPALLSIYKPYVEGTAFTFEYAVPSLNEFTSRFHTIAKKYPWLVCEIDGKIAGYAYAGPVFERMAYQWNAELSIYLAPEYHKRKIGTALYYCLFDLLYLQGYYKIISIITSANTVSIKLHEALGFTEFACFKNIGYKFNQWHDVTWLEKDLRDYQENVNTPISIHELPAYKITKICAKYESLIV